MLWHLKGLKLQNKTIILDIDGCILRHQHGATNTISKETHLLPGVLDKFNEWDKSGYKIVLMTARKESSRGITESHLKMYGLFWDHLVMGVGNGPRILINDLKPDYSEAMAIAINLTRDEGLSNIET